MNKKGQIGISVTGIVVFFVSFIVLVSLMPTIIDFIVIANNISNLSSATKVVLNLVPLMLGIAALIGAITLREA